MDSFIKPKPSIIKENNVISMSIFCSPVEYGRVSNREYIKAEMVYNKAGNMIERREFKAGRVLKKESFSYDPKGDVINPNKKVVEINENGQKVETTFYLNGKIMSRVLFNSQGICIESFEYQKEVIVRHKKFDERGLLQSDSKFTTQGISAGCVLYEYDKHNNNTRIKKINKNGIVKQDRTLVYDSNNNLIEDKDIPRQGYKLYSDEMFEVIKEDHLESYKHCYSYDKKNLVVEQRSFLANNLYMVYRYRYVFGE